MPQQRNKYGLSRHIPNAIARQVRRQAGFGCVRCGNAIYTYEHLDPEFAEATHHDPNGIILLCGGCAIARTKGLLSVETLRRHAAKPACKVAGFAFGEFDVICSDWPEIKMGSATIHDVLVFLRICEEEVFSVRPPMEDGQPFRINALFRDLQGNKVLEIVDNEWRAGIDSWDVTLIGRRLTIRSAKGQVALTLRADPPRILTVEELDMQTRGINVRVDSTGKLIVQSIATNSSATFTGTQVRHSDYAIDVDSAGAVRLGVLGPRAWKRYRWALRAGSSLNPILDNKFAAGLSRKAVW